MVLLVIMQLFFLLLGIYLAAASPRYRKRQDESFNHYENVKSFVAVRSLERELDRLFPKPRTHVHAVRTIHRTHRAQKLRR